MPVLRLYLDGETDLRPDYRLNRGSLEHLMAITRSRQDHGWAEEVRPDDNATMPHHHQDQQSGDRIRENLAAAVSAPDALVAALEGHDYT
ncbi:unnamed protein product [Arctogadus glacialis]